jgi:hypothetical protein
MAKESGKAPQASPPIWSRKVWTGTANVEVAVFEKDVNEGASSFKALNVSVKRVYKDGDTYKTVYGFRADDLPFLIQLLTQAYAFISDQMNKK